MTEHHPPGRRRSLSDDEIDIWLHVARGIDRLPGRTLPERRVPEVELAAPAGPVPPPPDLTPRPAPPVAAEPRLPAMAPLDRRQRQRLTRGQISIEAAIDLHGLRQVEAHTALLNFLLRAQTKGERLVLVVTGKGRTAGFDETGWGRDIGVLRRSVPLWLGAPELRSLIVGFEPASATHGGAGALYVRLRRPDRGTGR